MYVHNDTLLLFDNKTANINIEKCSFSVVSTVTDQKLKKITGNITFSMIFAVLDPSLLTL